MHPIRSSVMAMMFYGALLFIGAAKSEAVCPPAPQNIGHDLVIDAKGKIQGLGQLAQADLQGRVVSIAKDFFSAYKNADKVLVAQLLVSSTCEMLKGRNMSDEAITSAIASLRSDILKLMMEEREKENKPKVELMFDGGVASLVNSGGKIRNLDYKTMTVLRLGLRPSPSAYYGVDYLVSDSPGTMAEVREDGQIIYLINTEQIYEWIVTPAIQKIAQRLNVDPKQIYFAHFTCPKIEYDDENGGHYRHFLSLRVFSDFPPRRTDMHESKLFYDDCAEDFRYRKYPAATITDWSGDELVAKAVAKLKQ